MGRLRFAQIPLIRQTVCPNAGLDVSVKETSVCIVDDEGKIVREVKVASEPDALLAVLAKPGQRFKRIGLEADRCRNGYSVLSPKRACR